ncbi:uncharacterized protein DFL_003744 [Arthrobotrys flagrans]|uniref:Uncharacterized protein n=1 Tax=Arthrobotrys flagrans TaxID=97331 RepID=A0A437A2S6_ARTFL|nr:hypothetical protein DFL_003744 [Arthrobotrys flagrans]
MSTTKSSSRIKIKQQKEASNSGFADLASGEDVSVGNASGPFETLPSDGPSTFSLNRRRPALLPVETHYNNGFIATRLNLTKAEFDHIIAVIKEAFSLNPQLWGKPIGCQNHNGAPSSQTT